MTWQQFSVTCQAGQLEQVEDLMMQLGALSISLADAGDEPIYEPLPGDNPIWSQSVVTATFDTDSNPEFLQQELAAALPAELAASVTHASFQDRDWETAYRQHFKPKQCGEGLWIVPTWIDPPEADAVNIRLDPGLAFGTGGHPTTFMCLEWLAGQRLDDLDVIDFGCGSGILAIAASRLGANHVRAVDIDPQAIEACRSNMQVNGIAEDSISYLLPAQMDDAPSDLLIANILAGPLVELAAQFAGLVRAGGRIVLSGILATQLGEIESTYARWFTMQPARTSGEWACIAGERTDGAAHV